MRISLAELKKALAWIEVNTLEQNIKIDAYDQKQLKLKCFDKYEAEIEIVLFADNNMMAKIKKTDLL